MWDMFWLVIDVHDSKLDDIRYSQLNYVRICHLNYAGAEGNPRGRTRRGERVASLTTANAGRRPEN